MPGQVRNSSFQKEFGGFEKLMPFRVRNILLAASLYDSFLLADDENLNEALFGYSENAADGLPKITRVSSADEALKQLRLEKYDLVISMLQPEDAGFTCFFRDIKTITYLFLSLFNLFLYLFLVVLCSSLKPHNLIYCKAETNQRNCNSYYGKYCIRHF